MTDDAPDDPDPPESGGDCADPAPAAGATGEGDPSGRRRFLKLAGTTGIALTVAGCNHGSTSNQKSVVTKRKQAKPVGLTQQGVLDLGYPAKGAVSFTDTSSFTYSGSAKNYSYLLTDHRFVLEEAEIPLEVVASPSVTVAGGERNPLLAAPLEEHATRRRFGLSWLTSIGPLSGSFLEYKVKPTPATQAPYNTSPSNAKFFGTKVSYEGFESVVGPSGNSSKRTWTRVHHALARTKNGGDGVLVGAVAAVPYRETVPAGRLVSLLERAMETATRTVPSSFPDPDTTLRRERLVQTVSDSRVVNRNPRPYVATEPDLVLDQYVAPLFGFGGSSHPEDIYVDISGPVSAEFSIARQSLGSGDLGDVASILDESGPTKSGPTIAPFRLRQNTGPVDISAEAPCGRDLDSATISKSDYSTASQGNLRIGFISCEAPNFLGSNGYGSTSTYNRTVDMAVQYLRRVFPGGLYAYRHDNPIVGKVAVGSGALPGINQLPFLRDAGNALRELETVSNNLTASTPHGELFARPTGTPTKASKAIRNNGFNAWMLIVPAGYYSYHSINASGKTPFVPKNNSSVPYNWYAATALEQAGRPDRETVQTVAHELGHFFGGLDPYRAGPSDRPMAQRDDRGKQDTINGRPVDYAHARNPNSRHIEDGVDDDGDGSVDEADDEIDAPGIESLAFDFTGGTFRHVQTYSINPTFGSNPGMDINDPSVTVRGDPNTVESHMSYRSGRALWSDAYFHQHLIDGNWSKATAKEVSFVARGRPEEDAPEGETRPLRFGSVRVARTAPFPEDLDGEVEATMHSPSGEPLASRQVPAAAVVSEDNMAVPSVVARLPFPMEAVEFRAVRDGRTTRLNAIVEPIRDAVERVPDRGFVEDPETARGAISERLGVVERRMDEGEYSQAGEELGTLQDLLEDTVRTSYDALANQPGREALRTLVGRMRERLAAVAEGR